MSSTAAKSIGSRLFLGLTSQFSKPNAMMRAPPSSLIPLSKAYNALSLASAPHLKPKKEEPISRHVTGAGVILFDKDTDSVILFQNSRHNCYEEPGGFLKPNSDPATSASLELFEESCTLINQSKTKFLKDFVEVSGRSKTSAYRGYFTSVEAPPSNSQFLQKRSELEQQGYPSDYLETKGMVFIPIQHLAASLKKSVNWEQHSSPVGVKDIYGVEIPVSQRTMKLFKEGGLNILQQFGFSTKS